MDKLDTPTAANRGGSRYQKRHCYFTAILNRIHAALIRTAAWLAVVLGASC
jgi:hypothetical protein